MYSLDPRELYGLVGLDGLVDKVDIQVVFASQNRERVMVVCP